MQRFCRIVTGRMEPGGITVKRLYYIFHGVGHARRISDDLHQAGLRDRQLHFLSRDQGSLQLANIPAASRIQERDLQRSGIYGSLIGLGVGILFAFYLTATKAGGHLGPGMFLLVCGIFTFFGTWTGGIVGISIESQQFSRFHDALDQGDTLLMLDTYTPQQESQVRDVMYSRHLEASFEGEDRQYREFFQTPQK